MEKKDRMKQNPRPWRRLLGVCALALLLPLLLPAAPARAEGSRELTDSGGNRPYTEYRGPIDAANGSFLTSSTSAPAERTYYNPGGIPSPRSIVGDLEPDRGAGFADVSEAQSVTGSTQRRTLVYVYAEQGETIMLGSSSVGIGVGVDTDSTPSILTDCAIKGDNTNAVSTDPAVFCGMIGFVPPGGDIADMRFFDPVTAAPAAYPPSAYGSAGTYPQPTEPCGRIDNYPEEVGVANMASYDDGNAGNGTPPPEGYNACLIRVDGTDGDPNNDPGLYEIHFIPPDRFQGSTGGGNPEAIANPPLLAASNAGFADFGAANWEDASNFTNDTGTPPNARRDNIPADNSGEPRYDVPYTTAWEVQVLRDGADPFNYDYLDPADQPVPPLPGPNDGSDVIFGRVWSNYLALNMGTSNLELSSRFFVITDKGARYLVDLNKMDPFGFIFFSNNKGNIDSTTGEPIYRSLQFIGTNVGQIYPDAGDVNPIPAGNRVNNYGTHPPTGFDANEWNPGEPTTIDRNVTNKLFLRQISDDIPPVIPGGQVGTSFTPNGGTTPDQWGNVAYEEPDLPSFLFPLPTPPLPADTFIPTVETLAACSVAPTCPTFPADARGPDYTTGDKPAFIYRPKDAVPGPGDTVPGGYFFFTNVDNTGAISSYRIVVDTDNSGTFGDGDDRVLIGRIEASPNDGEQVVNVVEWDGLDEAGNQLAETALISARIFFQAGEIHFPLFDVERYQAQDGGLFVHRIRPVDDSTISPQQYPAVVDPNLTPVYANYTTLYYDNRYNYTAGDPAGTYDFSPCAETDEIPTNNRNTEDWVAVYGVSSNNPPPGTAAGNFNARCEGRIPATRDTTLSGTFENPRFSLASVFGVPGGTGAGAVNNEPALGVLQFEGDPLFGGEVYNGFGNQRGLDVWTNVNYTIQDIGPTPTSVSLLGVQASSSTNALPGVAAAGLALLALLGAAATLRLRRRTR